jgi:hypothetical protein
LNSPPRRARFQIHLSTAIVLMFVAGFFIWANVNAFVVTKVVRTQLEFSETRIGWPYSLTYEQKVNGAVLPVPWEVLWIPLIIVLLVDALIALGSLLVVWFLCEWLIRRRAARKGA